MPPLPPVSNTAKVTVQFFDQVSRHDPVMRFHYKWDTGSAQTADMLDLATNVGHVITTDLLSSSFITSDMSLTTVTAEDLTSSTGPIGVLNSTVAGSGGAGTDKATAAIINWHISRRYRGGKPKSFVPGLTTGAVTSGLTVNSTLAAQLVGMATDLYAGTGYVLTQTYPNISGLHLVNVSYYLGFTNYTKPSGREASRPTLRAVPVTDVIFNGTVRSIVGTQRRRLLAS